MKTPNEYVFEVEAEIKKSTPETLKTSHSFLFGSLLTRSGVVAYNIEKSIGILNEVLKDGEIDRMKRDVEYAIYSLEKALKGSL